VLSVTTDSSVGERRTGLDRRVRRVSFRYPERRSGFDRRHAEGTTVRASYLRALDSYRRSPAAIAVVIGLFLALSAADLGFTLRALDAGATEINPVMAALFEVGPVTAGLFKMGLALVVAVVMWVTRRYRRVLEVSLLAAAVMALLAAYHLALSV
jgi:hypothetical protein